jgi:hypothetical protein
MAPIAGFETGDVGSARVGDEDLVPPATGVKETELGAILGLFSSHNGPGAFGPIGEVEIAELSHFRPFTDHNPR